MFVAYTGSLKELPCLGIFKKITVLIMNLACVFYSYLGEGNICTIILKIYKYQIVLGSSLCFLFNLASFFSVDKKSVATYTHDALFVSHYSLNDQLIDPWGGGGGVSIGLYDFLNF